MNQWTHCENVREIPENKLKSVKQLQEILPKVGCDRESHCSDNPVRLSELFNQSINCLNRNLIKAFDLEILQTKPQRML